MKLEDVKPGWMHHTKETQGSEGNSEPYRVQVSSVKALKRRDQVTIKYRWGQKDFHTFTGTKAEAEAWLENWHKGQSCEKCGHRLDGLRLVAKLEQYRDDLDIPFGVAQFIKEGKSRLVDQDLINMMLEDFSKLKGIAVRYLEADIAVWWQSEILARRTQ